MRRKCIILILFVCLSVLVTGCKTAHNVEGRSFTATIDGVEIKGEYSGTIEKGVPNGQGTFYAQYEDGSAISLSGQWINGDCDSTPIVSDCPYVYEYDGNKLEGVFSGEIANWAPNGEGSFSYSHEDEYFDYNGSWRDGKFSGKGHLSSNIFVVHFMEFDRKGTVDGDTEDGLISGQGTFTAVNSDGIEYTYTGEWKNSLFDGQGKAVFEGGEFYESIGTYTQGEFTPTVYEYFESVSTVPDAQFSITENACAFLQEYPEAFLTNSVPDNVEFVKDFNFLDFAKNPRPYGDKLIKVDLTIVQIFEYEEYGREITSFVASDANFHYYRGYMFGYSTGIYEGTNITMVALPISYFAYQNLIGGQTYAIACVAITIEKR